MKRTFYSFVFLILQMTILLLFYGCGPDQRDTENYGDLAASAGGIILNDPEKHKGGYGRSDCLVCHNAALNIHRNTGSPIDADLLNEQIKNNGESAYCMSCHGNNGT